MPLLNKKDHDLLMKKFDEKLKDDIKFIFFTQEFECSFCRETRQILEEVAGLSPRISFEVYNFVLDKDKAAEFEIDKIPATVIMGKKDYGVRFFGIPAGYEFTSLIESTMMVSAGESGLSKESKEQIKNVTEPLNIQVFVTPQCPYCPGPVEMAHRMAVENENITAAMVEASEFPHLAQRYNVSGVPKTVIDNGAADLVGALPEHLYVPQVLQSITLAKS